MRRSSRSHSRRKGTSTKRRQRRYRSVDLCVFAVLGIVVVILVVTAIVFLALFKGDTNEYPRVRADRVQSGPPVPQLDFTGFEAGEIITDAEFFDRDAMSEKDVTAFIAAWNKGCVAGPGDTPCLARWRETTPSFDADQLCSEGFQGKVGDSAASVIWRVAQGCGINPRVLLVILQKEQGLITASGGALKPWSYRAAMGYACPDHGHCDEHFAGLTRQVYFAARQLRRYEANPQQFTFRAHQNHDIAYHVDTSCGQKSVFIKNQATANLYNYTPYQPNVAALNGHGDECSSYGNRNFYAYYKAWFGQYL